MNDTLSELELTPGIRSKPITLKTIANQKFTIRHELGRVPAGWLVIDCNRQLSVWRSGPMDTKTIELMADQDAEMTLVLL